jgi:hypothetical protein
MAMMSPCKFGPSCVQVSLNALHKEDALHKGAGQGEKNFTRFVFSNGGSKAKSHAPFPSSACDPGWCGFRGTPKPRQVDLGGEVRQSTTEKKEMWKKEKRRRKKRIWLLIARAGKLKFIFVLFFSGLACEREFIAHVVCVCVCVCEDDGESVVAG